MKTMKPQAAITFRRDFASATDDQARQIDFTRSETKILTLLAAKPKTTVSRQQLLDAISGLGSDRADRSIDFVINRLRRKLDDSARNPRFIQTRYGEGYEWIGSSSAREPDQSAAYILVEIVGSGMLSIEDLEIGATFGNRITAALNKGSLSTQVVRQTHPETLPMGDQNKTSAYQVKLTFVKTKTQLDCIINVFCGQAGRSIHSDRFNINDNPAQAVQTENNVLHAADKILGSVWKSNVDGRQNTSLAVAMHDASGMPSANPGGNAKSWVESEKRLMLLKRENPDDPSLKILQASQIHSKYVLQGKDIFVTDRTTRFYDEKEIERLVIEALPFAQSQPEYGALAAKLLYFLDSDHNQLAVDMVETAHHSGTNIPANNAISGQIRCFEGDVDGAIERLQTACELAEYSSEFHAYALVLMCQACLASGDYDALTAPRKQLYKIRPLAIVFFEFIFTDAKHPSLRAKAAVLMLSRARASAILFKLHYLSGRLFKHPEHRDNFMRTPVSLMSRRFGASIVDDEISQTIPEIMARL